MIAGFKSERNFGTGGDENQLWCDPVAIPTRRDTDLICLSQHIPTLPSPPSAIFPVPGQRRNNLFTIRFKSANVYDPGGKIMEEQTHKVVAAFAISLAMAIAGLVSACSSRQPTEQPAANDFRIRKIVSGSEAATS